MRLKLTSIRGELKMNRLSRYDKKKGVSVDKLLARMRLPWGRKSAHKLHENEKEQRNNNDDQTQTCSKEPINKPSYLQLGDIKIQIFLSHVKCF